MIIARRVEVTQHNGITNEYTNVTQIHTVGNHLTINGDLTHRNHLDIETQSVVDKYYIMDVKRMNVEFEVKD